MPISIDFLFFIFRHDRFKNFITIHLIYLSQYFSILNQLIWK